MTSSSGCSGHPVAGSTCRGCKIDTIMRAAIYARISRDKAGAGLGVDRQEADCRDLAERLGWEVVRVYSDNDLSAYSGRPRPGYLAMLDDVRCGNVSAVIAWHSDRLHRRAAELEDFVVLAEETGLAVQTVKSGSVDLATASGRMVARMLGAAAQHEIDHARERMKRAKAQAAAEGRHRGGPRPFGYEPDGMTVREDEAAALLQAARDVLAGRTLAAIAREWNAAAIMTSTGRSWTYGALRATLCRPRNAGLVARGRPDRPGLEIVGPAIWPAIIPEDVWRATRDVLTDPSRRLQRGNEKRWLGSGLYRCGLCGGPLRVAPYKSNRTTRKWLYRCTASAHLTCSQDLVDETVLAVVRARLALPDLAALLVRPVDEGRAEALRAKRDAARARLLTFEADYAAGLVTGTQLATATARVVAEVDRLDAALVALVGAGPMAALAGAADPVAAFDAAPLDAQRSILDALAVVTIAPSGRGQKLGPERVRLEWRS